MPTGGEIPGLVRLIHEGAEAVDRLVAERALMREPEPAILMHRHVREHRRAAGAVACVSVESSESRLASLCDPCPRLAALHASVTDRIGARVESMVIGFESSATVHELFEREMNDRPLFHVVADDGATHTLWLGTRAEALMRAFRGVREGLLLEGHHRAPANAADGDALAMLVPMEHVAGRASVAFVHAERTTAFLAASQAVRQADSVASAPVPGHALVCTADAGGVAWHACKVPERFEQAAHQIESWAGVACWKPGSSMDRDAIEAQVRAGAAGCVIQLADPELSELRVLSEQGRLLPAASTWFEPRFRSGLCMAELPRIATTISR